MTDLFTENKEAPKTDGVIDETSILDVFADKLASITKEDGTPKYDDLGKALDALKASQEHIARIEAENATVRAEAARVKELEEVVKRMSNGDNGSGKLDGNNPPVNGGLSEQDAANLVRKILKEDQAVGAAKENVLSVQNKLVEKYGGEAGAIEALKAKAKELGTSLSELKELSATKPALVLSLFGGSTGSPSATISSINGSAFKATVPELKRPEQSLISGIGATDKARAEFLRKVKENTYKRLKVET